MTVTAVAVVGPAHRGSAARRRGEGSLSRSTGLPPARPGAPRRDSPLSAHRAAPPSSSGTSSAQSSKEDPFPVAPQPDPFPRTPLFCPARRSHTLRVTIFLLSVPRFACLDMVPEAPAHLATGPLSDPFSQGSTQPRPLRLPD